MNSRLAGFHCKPLSSRREALRQLSLLAEADWAALDGAGLSLAEADRLSENVIGLFGLPLSIGTNLVVNGRDVLVPMVIEEASVVAGMSHGALLARAGGGVHAEADAPVMIGQLQVLDVPDMAQAIANLQAERAALLAAADRPHPTLSSLGGGARELDYRALPSAVGEMLIVQVRMDVRDAMGANAVNTSMEAIAPLVEQLTGGRVVVRILSNLADDRLARADCCIPAEALGSAEWPGALVAQRIVEASAFAEVDAHRAATHNKGIMNGIDAAALATGNDWRALEAGAHAYAARSGRYAPLSTWGLADGALVGRIEMPMAVGLIGGATQAHPLARLALRILGVETASDLAQILAAVGLVQNLAALRALATEGIQRGHMRLHARQRQPAPVDSSTEEGAPC
ncbi:MAG: hydroxymethylglutaryl-CoA reductase, degradative [Anaerolineales bacterium]